MHHTNKPVVVAVSLAVILAACAQEPSDRYQQAYEAIDQVVSKAMDEAGTPGLALAITTGDDLLYEGYYGFADLRHKTPVNADTLFQIGSISKSFTALALMKLMDQGVFDPDRPVNEYLPWWEVQTDYERITGHHLLTHTAGIPANRDDITGGRYMAWALREQATAWPPGEHFHYSNVGYQTLGVVLEELAGEPYAKIIRRGILEPLGMDHSNASIELDTRTEQATGYIVAYDDRPAHRSYPLVEAPFLEYWMGDGSIQSTATDMAAYVRMLMKHGQGPNARLVSEAAFDRFVTPATMEVGDDGENGGYGYGIGVGTANGHRMLRHSGGMVGLYANMELDLTDDVGIVVLVNGPASWRGIFEYARKALSAARRGESPPPFPESEDPTEVMNASDFSGTFTSGAGSTIRFTASENHLTLQHRDGAIVLERAGKDSFLTPQPEFNRYVFSFGRGEDHQVIEVTHGPDWSINDRYAGSTRFETASIWTAYTGRYRSYSPWFPYFEVITRKDQLLAVIGTGSETGEGEIVLHSRGEGVFRPGEEPTPEVLRFVDVVDGEALRATWSGHEFFKISR